MRTLTASIALILLMAAAPVLALAQSSCPQLTTNLSRGSRGSDVVHLQQYLISQNLALLNLKWVKRCGD